MVELGRKQGSQGGERDLTPQLLGVIARKDPELYQLIKQEAEQRGAKPLDIIHQVLKEYYIVRAVKLREIDMETFLTIGHVWMDLLDIAIKFVATGVGMMFNNFLPVYNQLYTIADAATKQSSRERIVEKTLELLEDLRKSLQTRISKIGAEVVKGG